VARAPSYGYASTTTPVYTCVEVLLSEWVKTVTTMNETCLIAPTCSTGALHPASTAFYW